MPELTPERRAMMDVWLDPVAGIELGSARVIRAATRDFRDLLEAYDARGVENVDLVSEVGTLVLRRDELEAEKDAARADARTLHEALDADAKDLWSTSNAIKKVINGYWWLSEEGSQAEQLREEIPRLLEEVRVLVEAVQHPASRRFLDVMRATDYLKDVTP